MWKSKEELMKTKSYWLNGIQCDLFSTLESYMVENDINLEQFCNQTGYSKRFINQVLNGNFNGSIEKLIDLLLTIGKAPVLKFKDIEKIISEDSEGTKNDISSTKNYIR